MIEFSAKALYYDNNIDVPFPGTFRGEYATLHRFRCFVRRRILRLDCADNRRPVLISTVVDSSDEVMLKGEVYGARRKI